MSALAAVVRLGGPMRGRLALALIAGAGAGASAVGLAATSAWLIARAAEQPPVLHLLTAVTAVRAFGIARGVLRYLERLAAHDAAFRVLTELRVRTFARLVRLAPASLGELRSGDLLARLVTDVDTLADLWLRVLLPYGGATIVAIGALGLMAGMVPAAALLVGLALLVGALVAPVASGAVARRAERSIAPARGELAETAVDLVRGGPELLAAAATARATDLVTRADARLAAAERRVALGAGLGGLVAGLAAGFSLWTALVVGIVAVEQGWLPGVLLAVVALTPIALHEVIAPLVPAAQRLPGIAVAADRVSDVLRRPDPVAEPVAPRPLPAGPLGLRIEGLRLRHPGAPASSTVGPVDLDLPAGGRAIVTGASGSGKSTLVAGLLRFLDPLSGTVELVGADGTVALGDIGGDTVRTAVTACLQDPHLFDATVAQNLRIARPDASDGALLAVLGEVHLDGWVRSLPDGPATRVGEHGALVSGGQRQRLGLARALLAHARILLLDEPTEHLDEATAAAFAADLDRIAGPRTVLVLTHRPELFPAEAWPIRVALAAPPGAVDA